MIRSVLARIVKREGFAVIEAANGKEALVKMSVHPADFIITDIRMPELGGMELLIQVKKDYPEVRVAVITGYPGSYTPEEVIANGADHYILKPFKSEQICRAIQEMAALGTT